MPTQDLPVSNEPLVIHHVLPAVQEKMGVVLARSRPFCRVQAVDARQ
jgi:hypothetical protein